VPVWKAALLGLVQGLAEFLPISSSGHLKLAEHFLGLPIESMLSFDVLLHVATLLAILIYFREDLVAVFGGFVVSVPKVLRKGGWAALDAMPDAKLGWLVMLTLIPTGILAVLFGDLLEQMPVTVVGATLMITGLLNWYADRRMKASDEGREITSLSVSDALLCGLAQGIALTPGISRSGSTIAAGLNRGLSREAAPRFAFLMAIPAIAAAAIKELPNLGEGEPLPLLSAAVGFVIAFASGYWAMRTIFSMVKRGNLRGFAYYCWIVGGLGLVLSLLGR